MRDIKNKLNEEMSDITPNLIEDIINNKGSQEVRSIPKKNYTYMLKYVFAIIPICLIMLTGINMMKDTNSYEVILDVNPSFKLIFNSNNELSSVEANNKDAEVIIANEDIDDLEDLIEVLINKGYITDNKNSLLLSLCEENKQLEDEIKYIVDTKLKENAIEGSLITQNIDMNDKTIEEISDRYDISLGKAKIINSLISNNNLLKIEDLVGLNIYELNVLIQENNITMPDIVVEGKVPTGDYISKEEAYKLALNALGNIVVVDYEIEMESVRGVLYYEVEFIDNKFEYSVLVNATTKEVIIEEKELIDVDNDNDYDDLYDDDDFDDDDLYDDDDDDDDDFDDDDDNDYDD